MVCTGSLAATQKQTQAVRAELVEACSSRHGSIGLSLSKPDLGLYRSIRVELVETGVRSQARWFVPRVWSMGGGRESPGVRVTFFWVVKRKSPKKRRPYSLRPFASLRATCGARSGGALRNSLRAARYAQTTAASQFTMRVSFGTRSPHALRSSAHPEGMGDPTSTRAIAALGPERAGASRRDRQAERSNGPCGCLAVRLPTPCGCACGGAVAGWHARRSAHASCTDSPQLSERSAQRAVSSAAHPATTPTQVCPFATRRGRRLGVALSLVTFFRRRERKLLRRRAHTPAPALNTGTPPHQRAREQRPGFDKLNPNGQGFVPQFRQAQPERMGVRKGKVSASSTRTVLVAPRFQQAQSLQSNAATQNSRTPHAIKNIASPAL